MDESVEKRSHPQKDHGDPSKEKWHFLVKTVSTVVYVAHFGATHCSEGDKLPFFALLSDVF